MRYFFILVLLLSAIFSNGQTKWQIRDLSNKYDTLNSNVQQLIELIYELASQDTKAIDIIAKLNHDANNRDSLMLEMADDQLFLLTELIKSNKRYDSLSARIITLESHPYFQWNIDPGYGPKWIPNPEKQLFFDTGKIYTGVLTPVMDTLSASIMHTLTTDNSLVTGTALSKNLLAPDPGELDTLQCVRIVTDEQPSHHARNKPYLLKLSGVYNNYVNRFIEYLNLDRTPKNHWLKVWNF